MYKLLVILKVRDFAAFDKFEQEAARIMTAYGGRIAEAFETERNADGSGEEIHLLEFDTEDDFGRYRSDPGLQQLSALREQAIMATEIKICRHEKSYP